MAINLLHGDCLELMKNIPDKSIDMILVDPPYALTPCKWDKKLNWPNLWVEMERIITPIGSILIFGTEPFSSEIRLSNKNYKYDLYWVKCKSLGANFCHAKNSPIRIIETISVFSKGKINHIGKSLDRMNYFPQGLKDCNIVQADRGKKINSFKKHIYKKSHKTYKRYKTNYPTNILDFKFDNVERKNRKHPTQKPVSLLEYLIKTYTLENETVLDFTMGSGSTGVACKNLNRNFVGIELDENYFNIAKNRIEKHEV